RVRPPELGAHTDRAEDGRGPRPVEHHDPRPDSRGVAPQPPAPRRRDRDDRPSHAGVHARDRPGLLRPLLASGRRTAGGRDGRRRGRAPAVARLVTSGSGRPARRTPLHRRPHGDVTRSYRPGAEASPQRRRSWATVLIDVCSFLTWKAMKMSVNPRARALAATQITKRTI